VRIGAARVGLLERFEEWDYRFSFDPGWLQDPERPVLGQIFEDRRPREMESTGHVPCWFDHLLPPLHSPLRRAVARQAGVEPDDPQTDFDVLEYLGEDLPGAVVLLPSQARLALAPPRSARPRAPDPGALWFSLAGQQWKLSVRAGDRGLVIPVHGESGAWIAKFHDPSFAELPRVELDRPVGHTQYGAQLEEIAAVVASLAPSDLRQFCARVVFSVLCGNTDGHLKNWSLLYPDGHRAALSPAYDLIASVLYVPPLEDRLALSLRGSRRFEDVRIESFEPMAAIIGVPFAEVARWVREAVERTKSAFFDSAAELPFSAAERARLAQHFDRVPLGAARP